MQIPELSTLVRTSRSRRFLEVVCHGVQACDLDQLHVACHVFDDERPSYWPGHNQICSFASCGFFLITLFSNVFPALVHSGGGRNIWSSLATWTFSSLSICISPDGYTEFLWTQGFHCSALRKKKFIHFDAVYVRRRGDVVMKECTVLDNFFFFWRFFMRHSQGCVPTQIGMRSRLSSNKEQRSLLACTKRLKCAKVDQYNQMTVPLVLHCVLFHRVSSHTQLLSRMTQAMHEYAAFAADRKVAACPPAPLISSAFHAACNACVHTCLTLFRTSHRSQNTQFVWGWPKPACRSGMSDRRPCCSRALSFCTSPLSLAASTTPCCMPRDCLQKSRCRYRPSERPRRNRAANRRLFASNPVQEAS